MEYVPANLLELAGQGYDPTETPLNWALSMYGYPVITREIGGILQWYPVCFMREADDVHLVMPISPERGKSTLINEQTGRWIGQKPPFFIRRFPFRLDYPAVEAEQKGVRLLRADVPEARMSVNAKRIIVDLDGSLNDIGRAMMKRMVQYDRVHVADRKRTALLNQLDVLVPLDIDFGDLVPDADAPDFLRIDETALMALDEAAIAELHVLRAWRMIYGHLFSMRQLGKPKRFRDRLLQHQDTVSQSADLSFDILGDDGDDLISF